MIQVINRGGVNNPLMPSITVENHGFIFCFSLIVSFHCNESSLKRIIFLHKQNKMLLRMLNVPELSVNMSLFVSLSLGFWHHIAGCEDSVRAFMPEPRGAHCKNRRL